MNKFLGLKKTRCINMGVNLKNEQKSEKMKNLTTKS